MKDRFARLLFAYLARLGLVLCVADPDAPAAGGEPAASTPAASADPTGAAGETDGTADPSGAPDTRDPRDIELELLRKEKAKLERRFGRRTKAYYDALAENAQLQAAATGRPTSVRTPEPDDDHDDDDGSAPPARREPAVDPRATAVEIAADMRRRDKIAENTSAMLDAGKKLDPKFRDLALDVANDLPFVDERTGRPTEFIEAVLDGKEPAALLLHLARNPDAVESLQGLRGVRLGARLAEIRLEAAKAPPTPSKAPKPLEALGGGGGNSAKAEKTMTDAEWRDSRLAKRA